MKFLYNIQKKPKHVRQKYALGFASGFTALVAVVWFMNSVVHNPVLGDGMNDFGEGGKTFTNLFKQSKEQLANINDSIKEDSAEDLSASTTKENEATSTNPANIKLSQEEIDLVNSHQASSSYNNQLSTSTNYFNDKSIPREVMIATTSSSSTKKQIEDKASTSDSLPR